MVDRDGGRAGSPSPEGPRPIRLAVLCDMVEEGWRSMDLFAEMILDRLGAEHPAEVAATRVCPPLRPRLSRRAPGRLRGTAWNADRLLNRSWDYPRVAGRLGRGGGFDLFHVVDHTYAQLVHALPRDRTVVTCHDLDAFRCLLEPAREPRPRWFRAMAGRILGGMQEAAMVACDSEATYRAIRAHDLIPEARLRVVPAGTSPEFGPDPDPAADLEAGRIVGPVDPGGPPELLHVGSTIPRKRIDILLEVFSEIRRARPGTRLVRVGGPFTVEQRDRAMALGLDGAIVEAPPLDRATIAGLYRRADLVLQPSDAEGFGLPVAEALACGASVLASDIEALRESGGEAASFRPVGDVPAWAAAALALIDGRRARSDAWRSRREAGFAQAARFSWSSHVEALVGTYREVLDGQRLARGGDGGRNRPRREPI